MEVLITTLYSKSYNQVGYVVGTCIRNDEENLIIKLKTPLDEGTTHARVREGGYVVTCVE